MNSLRTSTRSSLRGALLAAALLFSTTALAGPPLLGFLGDHVGVLRALLVVGAMVALALLGVPAMREPQRSTAHDADPA